MTGSMVHVPHVHTRPPMLSNIMYPVGSVWACECGKRWTLASVAGRKIWASVTVHTDDLDDALQFIREEANRHRRALGLEQI